MLLETVCNTTEFFPGRHLSRMSFTQSFMLKFFLCLSFYLAAFARPAERTAPADAARLNNIGVALMNQQFTEKALVKFQAAYAADPSAATPLLNQGIALLYLQRLPGAETALKQATSMDPKNIRAWYCLGLVHLDAGDPKAAIEEMQHAVALDPSNADTHYFIGLFYLSLSDYPHAKEAYEAALRLNPIHASAQFGLARVLQHIGQSDESRKHLKRFQELTQNKISSPFSAAYGEQGRYAMAEDMVAPVAQVEAMIPISFAPMQLGAAIKAQAGTAACIMNIGTPEQKYLVLLGNGDHAIHLYKNFQTGNPEEIPESQSGLIASGEGVACAVADYDNDGLPDLAIALRDRILLFHNLGNGKFENVTKASGIRQMNHPAGLLFLDFDHDGDVDLFVTGSLAEAGPSVLWRNNGDSTFTEWTGPTGLSGQASTTGATLSDINNDRAIDLVVAGHDHAPTVYENQREGKFKPVALYSQDDLAPTRGVYAFDFDKDGWMDIAVTHAGTPGISLWRNVQGKSFERMALPLQDATEAWGLTAIDIDNDGWIDLAALVQTAHGPQLRILRNRGAQGFEDVSEAVGVTKLNLQDPRSLIATDIDGDGAADLIVTQLHSAPFFLKNIGGNKNHSLRIAFSGLADNKSAIGTKVEIFADGQWQKFETTGGAGYLGQGATDLIAGTGHAENADVVRLLWPTGVPQDEIDISAAKPLVLKELDRRGSSCPVLFAWDGKKYQFISDVIGAAVIGHWISPTATNQADPDEWIKIDGSQLQPRDSYLSVRFGEPMEEINFVDQVRMVAVDHPEDTEVYPDERFLNEPPFASGEAIVASSSTRPLAGAWDSQGHDISPLLAQRDHQYVRDFTNLTYAGFAKPHTLTLDLGEWSVQNPLRLLMHGFIEYFSASSMYAAWQAGLQPMPPYVEAQMPDGSWKKIIDDMGFPAGLPRTIVVDLSHKLPVGTRRIRLTTNLQIYWDQILVDNGPDAARNMRETELSLGTAHLAFRGYPQQIDGATPGDLTYRYDRISTTGPFQWQRGNYTHYGNVTPLLKKPDNQYVIFGSGEEIDAEFSATSLPALPAHWKRDYFFYANGFVKDMDFYEALPFTVAQMPFHEMSTYPYPAREHYPENPSTLQYRLDWNDRFESGDRKQRFQFDYRPAALQPITQP